MVLWEESNHYEPISWEEAFGLLAGELNSLASPHEAAFYTSGRASNEAAYLYQLFARYSARTISLTVRTCATNRAVPHLRRRSGVGKGTVTLDDFLKADAIFVVGQNPGTNHPRMLTSLELAKKNGAKIISVNPLPEVGNFRFKNPNPQSFKNPLEAAATFFGEGAQLSDLWLQVKINGDLALFKGHHERALGSGTKISRESFRSRFHRPIHGWLRRFVGGAGSCSVA